MKRLAAVCAVFALSIAGCGGESRAKPAPFQPKAGDIKLPALPARGLVVNKRSGVALIGLDGKRYGFLTGLKLPMPGFARFPGSDPNLPRVGKKGASYVVDAVDGYAVRSRSAANRLELGNGYVYRQVSVWSQTDRDDARAVHLSDWNNGEGDWRGEIYRGDRMVVYLGSWDVNWITHSGGLVTLSSPQSPASRQGMRRMLDLSSGSIEPLPAGCTVYGRRDGVLNALCTGNGDKRGLVTLSLRRQEGKSWPVVFAWRHVEGEWLGGVLSPDGRFVLVSHSVPCDTDMAEIVDAQGPRRTMLGEGEILGWSASGKAIVYLEGKVKPGCEAKRRPLGAVYAIDPVSLRRTLIVKTRAAALWDKTPGA
ncbi:MAG: hypothetical protein ABSC36_03950 [Gaiellaceae bacterium]